VYDLTERTVLPHLESSSISPRSESPDFSTYAPVDIQCPERSQWVRHASGLSDEEAAWVKGRKAKVLSGLKSYLGRLNFEDFDLDEYVKRIECDAAKVPTIGMVISGGGKHTDW
jgi:lysophospholipase